MTVKPHRHFAVMSEEGCTCLVCGKDMKPPYKSFDVHLEYLSRGAPYGDIVPKGMMQRKGFFYDLSPEGNLIKRKRKKPTWKLVK